MNRIVKLMAAVVAVVAMKGLAQANPPQIDPTDWRLGVRISANPGGGLLIHHVFPGSPAERVGLQPGMVILTIDGVLYNDPLMARDKIMLHGTDHIDIVYQDATGFYQVTADLVPMTITTVVTQAYNGKVIQKAVPKVVPKVTNIYRKRVTDPRRQR